MNRHLFHPIKLAKSESTSAEVAWCYMTHRAPGCPCHRYNDTINIYKIIQRSRKLHQFCKTCVKSSPLCPRIIIDLPSLISLNHQNGKPTNTGEFPAGLLKLWHQYLWHYSTSRVSWSYALLGPSAAVGCNSTIWGDRMDGQTWKKTAPQLNAGAPQRGRELNWRRIR